MRVELTFYGQFREAVGKNDDSADERTEPVEPTDDDTVSPDGRTDRRVQ